MGYFLRKLLIDKCDELGLKHYVDNEAEFDRIMSGEFIDYVHELKRSCVIRHVGISTHNPKIAKMAALSGEVEMLLFSINPAFDLMPATEVLEDYFAEEYDPAPPALILPW